MASHPHNDFAAGEKQEAAARLARRIAREERRRAERRRSWLVAGSMAVASALLLAGGLSAAAGASDGQQAGFGSASAQEPAPVGAQAPAPATSAVATPSSGVAEDASQDSDAQKRTADAGAPPSTPEPTKATATVPENATREPSKKVAPKTQRPGILVRKCSGAGCHSVAEISGARVDLASAVGAVEAMVDGGRVKLTSKERAAVIAALTGR